MYKFTYIIKCADIVTIKYTSQNLGFSILNNYVQPLVFHQRFERRRRRMELCEFRSLFFLFINSLHL